jgi:hypothetical protein
LSAAALDSLLRFSTSEMDLFLTVGSELASSCLQLMRVATFAISSERRVGEKEEKVCAVFKLC